MGESTVADSKAKSASVSWAKVVARNILDTSPLSRTLSMLRRQRAPRKRLGEDFGFTLKDITKSVGGVALSFEAWSPGTRKYGIKKHNSSSGLTSEDPFQVIENSCMKAEVDTVTVWYTDACSVSVKWGELATRTQTSVIIAIIETWMRYEQDVEKPRDYSACRQDRMDGRQGEGVLLLVKAAFTQRDSPVKLATPNIQAKACSILLGRRPLGVLLVYRAPQAEPKEDMELLATMQEFISKTQRILILGDLNLPEICWVEAEAPVRTKGESFLTWLHERALIQHIMQTTRFRNQQRASVLDLVITRYLSEISEEAVENPLCKSDPGVLRLALPMKHSKPAAPPKRCYRRINVAALQEAAEHVDWVPLSPGPTLEERWSVTQVELLRLTDGYAPFKPRSNRQVTARSGTSSPEEMLGPF
ncbi:unnamed protein product [Echinostoma caproni]|uniref:Endo/exonuclease/phosphatase domain-containing protein n=1 Tax=Echinostoma caproni TaxID=27848 RepID=A0A183B5A5_9TREM|nr:unnamed protein product [Echinostoma caproni]